VLLRILDAQLVSIILFFSSNSGDVSSDMQSHFPCSHKDIVQTMSAAEGSVVKAPDHQQQSAEAGMDTPSNVGVNWSGSQPHAVPPSVLSTCPDSESISILQTTNICFDDLNKTSLDLFAADLHDHTQRETTSPVTKELCRRNIHKRSLDSRMPLITPSQKYHLC